MNTNKAKIIVAIGIVILFVFIIFFVWIIFFKTPQSKPKQISTPIQLPIESAELKFKIPATETLSKSLPIEKNINITTLPIQAIPFFENIRKAAKAVEKTITSQIYAPTKNTSSALTDVNIIKATTTEIFLSLTNDEFHFLYPDSFITSLVDAQNIIKQNFDSNYEPLPKIETDAQVRLVEEKIVSAFLSNNLITQDQAQRYIATIRVTLPRLQIIELKTKGFFDSYESAPFSEFLNTISKNKESLQPTKGLFLAGLLEKLSSLFPVNKAQAYCGYCTWQPECFISGVPKVPVDPPGINTFKIACHCFGCLSGLGCIDFCEYLPSIWDITTGICGCGY